jgi:hypothetical protein
MPSTQTATAAELARALEQFLVEHPRAAVFEESRLLFDMRFAHYSLSTEHSRCLLHLWSGDRNLVRSVSGLDVRKDTLRIETRRFGQTRSQILSLVADPDRRTPSDRETTRTRYLRILDRVLTGAFPDWKIEGLRTAMDLEHSFGPAYARGMLIRGQSAWAVIAVNEEESQPTIDGALTRGILWLAYCREHGNGRRYFEGVKVIVPCGTHRTTQARMAWMHATIAKWELYELEDGTDALAPVDIQDIGNLNVHLTHAFHPQNALERSSTSIELLLGLLPDGMREVTEIRPRNSTEISFLLHGLEYARIQHGLRRGSFDRHDEITFGAGPNETQLTRDTEDLFRDLLARLFESRQPDGTIRNPLFRMQPERWLESTLRADLSELEPNIRSEFVYTQVPAFSAGDRGMLDLLTVTRSGRLAIIELKANEDLHLPLQALDYWLRVRQLHRAGEFQKRGYFPKVELSDADPLLYLIAPTLRIHPSNETVLRHFAPEVSWELIGLDEHWRKKRRVILRRRNEN